MEGYMAHSNGAAVPGRAMENNMPVSDEVADRSIKFEVSLPSGRCETVTVSQSGTIADLKRGAQHSLGQPFLRLAAPDGRLLDPTNSLALSGLQDGDSLIAVALQPRIAATRHGFAAWFVGVGRVVTSDSSRVQDQLKDVQQIYSTERAFAAVLADGNVVTWGQPGYGGDSSGVQDQLKNVQEICGSQSSFAAVLADGSIVEWGNQDHGGDSSTIEDDLFYI